MPDLPFKGRGYRYSGRDERKQQKTAEKNRMVAAIARHANKLVADNPREIQQLYFASIAHELGYDVEIVRHALSKGGYNGITLRVTDEDRSALSPYKIEV